MIPTTPLSIFPRSTKKLLADGTEIPLDAIAYIQIGSDKLEEKYEKLKEPMKTLNSSRASIFISVDESHGASSVRIRLPDDTAAASLAAELRELVGKQMRL